ncbi:ATP-binding protein [Geothrix sp. PMB-07]|uniref:PAS domain-containing sensor histidine kinase n=1 Tax=Geothrix sp. PMB-07 TaxID=3068640 RepID=UPI0027419C64|nr:ATP-binding protein [Geothrix sp. PMB-07]WLT33181.1 ATP-binding protein [Geothrix sp. PMB-07]
MAARPGHFWISLAALGAPALIAWQLLRPAPAARPAWWLGSALVVILLLWVAALSFLLVRRRMELQSRLAEERDSQQRLLKAVMDAATEVALIATDAQGVIQLFNAGAEQMLGLKAQEVIHRMTPEAFHLPEEAEARGRELSEALGVPIRGFEVYSALPQRGLSEVRTWTYRRADGQHIPVRLAVTALRDRHGSLFGYLGVAQNMESQQARESTLAAAAQEAHEAARLKSVFLATMSHEIRTPMNAIMAMSRYLMTTNLDEDQREITEIGWKAARNLLDMLDRVLDLSKVEAGGMTLESSAFSPIVLTQDCASLWKADATGKGLAFLMALPAEVPAVVGDPLRLRQVINNLLGNALKFTAQGSITLRLQVEDEGPFLHLRWAVEDTGIGMSPAVLQRLFRPFTQADVGITRQYGGSGLGLALSHELLRLMGGSIQVESTQDKGTTFTVDVRLPRA